MIYVELKDFAENFEEYLKKDIEFISYNNSMYVLRGANNDLNEEFCRQNNIEIININHEGGTIVLDKSAIGYAYIANDKSLTLQKNFMLRIVNWLKTKNINAEYKDNDILIDGYKVCSAGTKNINDSTTYTTIHFSLENDAELISKICLKPMTKVPRGLSYYGINKEDVLDFLYQSKLQK